jgi:phage protein U
MTDASPSGSIATTFSNGGRFLRGGSTSGVGQEDQMQRIEGEIIKTNTNATLMTGDGEVDGAFSLGTYQPAGSASALTGGSTSDRYSMVFDSADSPNARTGSETRPINTTIKYYMRIK